DHRRDEDREAIEMLSAIGDSADSEGEKEREQDRERRRHEDEARRRPQRLPEIGVVERFAVVGQTNELRARGRGQLVELVLHEAQPQTVTQRKQEEDEEEREVRKEKRVSGHVAKAQANHCAPYAPTP